MKNKVVIILTFVLMSFTSKSAIVYDTIYINRGNDTLYSQSFYFLAFNGTPVYSKVNVSYSIGINDTLNLTIINNDSLQHSFTIDTIVTSFNTINPGDTLTVDFNFSVKGAYRFYSSLNNGSQLGASGVISVGYNSYKNYRWNLFDTDSAFSYQFQNNLVNVIDDMYAPSIYLINGKSYPQTSFDTTTLIEAMVGDTVIISVLNSGHMLHALHFHGFHVEILTASHIPNMIGWSKDSFPLHVGASVTLRLIPDKEGMYPVHDHNLIASTNAGMYPGGMMAMIDIMP